MWFHGLLMCSRVKKMKTSCQLAEPWRRSLMIQLTVIGWSNLLSVSSTLSLETHFHTWWVLPKMWGFYVWSMSEEPKSSNSSDLSFCLWLGLQPKSLEHYLSQEDPRLLSHLRTVGALPQLPYSLWFRRCFAGCLPESSLQRSVNANIRNCLYALTQYI